MNEDLHWEIPSRNIIKAVKEVETKARENMGHNTNKYQWVDCVSWAYQNPQVPVLPALALILIVSMHPWFEKEAQRFVLKLTVSCINA